MVFHCEALSHADSDFIPKDALLADLRPASFDFAAVASAIVDEIPSLRDCFLTVGAWIGKGCPHLLVERWCESRAWRIVHCEDPEDPRGTGRRELVELHNNVAETIIAKEDLGISMEEAARPMSTATTVTKKMRRSINRQIQIAKTLCKWDGTG